MKNWDLQIRNCAKEIMNLPYSICCDICTKEYCRDNKVNMSCLDCIEHYLKLHTREKTEG